MVTLPSRFLLSARMECAETQKLITKVFHGPWIKGKSFASVKDLKMLQHHLEWSQCHGNYWCLLAVFCAYQIYFLNLRYQIYHSSKAQSHLCVCCFQIPSVLYFSGLLQKLQSKNYICSSTYLCIIDLYFEYI